jgi:hypothetical protein
MAKHISAGLSVRLLFEPEPQLTSIQSRDMALLFILIRKKNRHGRRYSAVLFYSDVLQLPRAGSPCYRGRFL